MLLALSIAAGGTAGCSSNSLLKGAFDTSTALGDMESDGGATFDTGQAGVPAWWTMAIHATVSSGELQVAGSSLELQWLNSEGESICDGTAAVVAVEPASLDADGVFSWWELTAGSWSSDCGDGARESPVGTRPFYVGVGGLHVELQAQMGESTVDAALADNLNGAYFASALSGPVYAFGLAGLDSAFAGTTTASTGAPLADGDWSVVPLYPLP